jgi:two-component system response regulator
LKLVRNWIIRLKSGVLPAQPCRIVVADDCKDDVFFLEEGLKLTDLNYCLEHVSDGEEAVALLTRHCNAGTPPALFILDLYLPKVTGAEILEELRARCAECKLNILVLTGEAPEPEAVRLKELGASDVVRKPIDLAGFLTLGNHIRDLCGRERAREVASC